LNASIKPQPHSRGKKIKERFPRSPLKYFFILLSFFLLGVLGFIRLHVQTLSLSYDIASAQKQKGELMEINKKMRIQLANLKSPERIEGIALTQLGLRPPGKGQIEIIK
jgi:cell division protein FtsL